MKKLLWALGFALLVVILLNAVATIITSTTSPLLLPETVSKKVPVEVDACGKFGFAIVVFRGYDSGGR